MNLDYNLNLAITNVDEPERLFISRLGAADQINNNL